MKRIKFCGPRYFRRPAHENKEGIFVGLVTDENTEYFRGPGAMFVGRPTKILNICSPAPSLSLSLVSLARSFFCSPRRRTPRARTPHAARTHAAPCPVPAPPPHARTHGRRAAPHARRAAPHARRAVPHPRAAPSPWLVPAPPLRCAPSPHSPRRGRLVVVPRPCAAPRLARPSPCPPPRRAPSPCPPPRRAPSACPTLAVPAYSPCPPTRRDPSPSPCLLAVTHRRAAPRRAAHRRVTRYLLSRFLFSLIVILLSCHLVIMI
jgi:hypothetical protein